MNINKKNGFSLIELMVVVAIISILAVVGIPQYDKFRAKSRQVEAKAALGSLYQTETSFFEQWGTYTVDLRAMGFGVSGTNLRYNTGFEPAGCVGYPGTAPPQNTTVDNTLADGANVMTAGVTWSSDFANRQTVPTGTTSCTTATFTAISFGSPRNAFDNGDHDEWTINESKKLTNTKMAF